jgi:pimeloyl-ACP methyl ester carboxylesterase
MVSRRALGGTFAVLMTFALFGALSGSADAAEMRRDTHVYLLRGAMNIWSLGLDDLADASEMAAEALAGYRKGVRHIILIGHSWGANAAVDVAADLGKAKVPVDLIVLFDPSAGRAVVPHNVRKVVNFYIPSGLGYAAVGAKGQVQNVDEENNPDIGHLNIEKNKKLHAQTIRLILAAIGGSRRVPPPASSASVK